jgi:hypothetical protein
MNNLMVYWLPYGRDLVKDVGEPHGVWRPRTNVKRALPAGALEMQQGNGGHTAPALQT